MPNQFLSPEGDLENYFVTEYWLIDQWVGDQLWVWGNNNAVKLGILDQYQYNVRTPVTTFAGGTNWKQVSCGYHHTVAIKTDGTLWVWGGNSYGILGTNNSNQNNTPVTTFAGGTNWKQVSAGYYHTSAIKTDGTLWGWGYGGYGALGTNATTNTLTPVTTFAGGTNWKQVSSRVSHTAAVKTDGTLWIWGDDGTNVGKLGTNNSTKRITPVTTFAGGTNWKQVSCARNHTSAVKTDGTLWIWGQNYFANLGINSAFTNTTNKFTPVTTFAGGTNWKQVSCGRVFTAAIKTNGTLWTWGDGGAGQTGANNNDVPFTPVTTFAGGTNWKQVSSGEDHISAVKTDGTLWIWGGFGDGKQGTLYGNYGQNNNTPVTTFAGGTNWKQVDCGKLHTAAVFSGTTPDLPIS